MIKITNLNKAYGKTQVFADFNLEIEKGKITCLLGESGSGKTTLLNVLSGLTEYSGSITGGEQCSYAFQNPNLFANLTVEKNLTVIGAKKEKVNLIAEEFGISDKLNVFPSELSGGQAQRVSLARALLYEKPLLLLDEPFSNLDIGLKFKLAKSIKKYHAKTHNTVLMVTHDVKEAVLTADRILILKKGKIVYDNSDITKKTEEEIFDLLKNSVFDC